VSAGLPSDGGEVATLPDLGFAGTLRRLTAACCCCRWRTLVWRPSSRTSARTPAFCSSPRRAQPVACPAAAGGDREAERKTGDGWALAVPKRAQGLAVPKRAQGLAVAKRAQGLAVPKRAQGLAVPKRAPGLAVPKRAQGLAVPKRAQGLAVPKRAQGLAVPKRAQGCRIDVCSHPLPSGAAAFGAAAGSCVERCRVSAVAGMPRRWRRPCLCCL